MDAGGRLSRFFRLPRDFARIGNGLSGERHVLYVSSRAGLAGLFVCGKLGLWHRHLRLPLTRREHDAMKRLRIPVVGIPVVLPILLVCCSRDDDTTSSTAQTSGVTGAGGAATSGAASRSADTNGDAWTLVGGCPDSSVCPAALPESSAACQDDGTCCTYQSQQGVTNCMCDNTWSCDANVCACP